MLTWQRADVAQRSGRLERVEHVDNARQSAAHVASVLLKNNAEPYDYLCA